MADVAKCLLFEYYGIGRTEQADKGFTDNSAKDDDLGPLDDIDALDQDEDEEEVEDSDELEKENDADVAVDEKSETSCQPVEEETLTNVEFGEKNYETIWETDAALNNYPFKEVNSKGTGDEATTSNSNGVDDTSRREEAIDSSIMLAVEPVADNGSDISLPISNSKPKKRSSQACKTTPLPPAPKKIPTCNGIFLDLTAVGITVFPIEMLDKLSSLKMLYLDNNNLTSLPDDLFSILGCLIWLDVRNNELETLPSSIAGHPNLETILLQGNNIRELPLELSQLPNLKRLQVARNPLVFPPMDVIAQGCTAIVDCLQAQWNKIHPLGIKMENVDSTEHDKDYEHKYDATTALCYQPTSLLPKKHKASDGSFAVSESSVSASKRKDCTNEKSVRRKSWDYKPSNRYEGDGSCIEHVCCNKVTLILPNIGETESEKRSKDIDARVSYAAHGCKKMTPNNSMESSLTGSKNETTLPEVTTRTHRFPKESNGFQSLPKKAFRDFGCGNRGENPTISMQLAWINEVKEILTRQALALQRVKDKEALGNWRQDERSVDKSMEKARKRSADDIPFAIDTNDARADSKEPLKMHALKRSKRGKSALMLPTDINEKMTELSQSLSHLRIERRSNMLSSPRTEQKLIQMEIEKISQLQVQLEHLKLYNASATAPLLKTHEIRREQAARPPSIVI